MKLSRKRWIFLTAALLLFSGLIFVWWHMPLPKFFRYGYSAAYLGIKNTRASLENLINKDKDAAAEKIMSIFRRGDSLEKQVAEHYFSGSYWGKETAYFPEKHLGELINLYNNGCFEALMVILRWTPSCRQAGYCF